MGMKKMPQVKVLANGGKAWENRFDAFTVKVYMPKNDLFHEIINYGFMTPYLLVFEEQKQNCEEAVAFAEESGLAGIAASYAGSVVFVYPNTKKGWEDAPEDLFATLIGESKIGQYYEDGVTKSRNRFTGEWGDMYIRGALNRSYLFGFGKSADYIAKNCLKTIKGEGLYGKGDITPAACILENLSIMPRPERRDIPVISVGNSEAVNKALSDGLDEVLIKEEADYPADYAAFLKQQRRMVGNLDKEADLEKLGLTVEPAYHVVKTSADNRGDDKDTTEHPIGYVAYYQKGLTEKGKKLPLVLCFHGGGDSAMCMVSLSEWHLVVAENEFLLVSVENHMNSTATEAVALLEHLKEKYPVDETKIYATGFSMGGCKSWDLFQEYPELFAAVAPMDATFEVGQNVYGQAVEKINRDVILPVFYVGGEDTPLPELPFQEAKCLNRMAYVLKVNQSVLQNEQEFDKQDEWENPIWGISSDVICYADDPAKKSVLTMHLFESENGCCYSIFGSATNQSHEMRHLNCENAWKFMSMFRRTPDGKIEGGKMSDVVAAYNNW